ncbi:Kinesin-like protein [Spironucleus salmonicida]|uniref:Kinesin-like protein n=1 Tax=Spironucleus salmonicida TaxID=348837 RepID=V6LGL1_9EUKA|nr:Kinesin-like protein [Spironucleus salmonicida]|eukprot:EST43448.1 Kinesin [Spironucleus salmonicida]
MSNVRVFIRERPSAEPPIYTFQQNDGCVKLSTNNAKTTHHYTLDGVLLPNASQTDVLNQIGLPAVKHLMQSYNSSIICYGATFTGKSYTAIGDETNPGLAPQVLEQIFKSLEARQSIANSTVYISLLELYFDKPTDLINNQPLNIRQNEQGFFCDNLTTVEISSAEQGIQILNKAIQNRIVGSNYANEKSSRSHVLINFGVRQISRGDQESTASVLTIVDLAGSESIRKGNSEGIRLAEAQSINKTLSTLCQVVNALSTRKEHIPYRDSKLTKLLSQSLGGNSYTSIICTIDSSQEDESIQSIQFANRCRNVVNNPNIQYTDVEKIGQTHLIKKLQEENLQLKIELEDTKKQKQTLEETIQQSEAPFNWSQDDISKTETLSTKQTSFRPKSSENTQFIKNSQISQLPQNAPQTSQIAPQKDSISVLRQKLIAKNDQFQQVSKELSYLKGQNRQQTSDFKAKIEDLTAQIAQNSQLFELKMREKDAQKLDAVRKIAQGADSLLKTQISLQNSTFSAPLAPGNAEIDALIEDERAQIQSAMDVQNMQFREQIDRKWQFQLDELEQKLGVKSQIQSEILESVQNANFQLQEAVKWLVSSYKAVSSTLHLAREGKLDSFIVNESQVLQYLLSQQSPAKQLSKHRKSIHTCLILSDAQIPKQLPGKIANIIQFFTPFQGVESKNGNCKKQTGMSFTRPSSACSTASSGLNQPHLKTGFVKPKPAAIHLNMNVHISPRPQSGTLSRHSTAQEISSGRPNSGFQSRPGSGFGTNTGSCQGTAELSKKAYQQWGF